MSARFLSGGVEPGMRGDQNLESSPQRIRGLEVGFFHEVRKYLPVVPMRIRCTSSHLCARCHAKSSLGGITQIWPNAWLSRSPTAVNTTSVYAQHQHHRPLCHRFYAFLAKDWGGEQGWGCDKTISPIASALWCRANPVISGKQRSHGAQDLRTVHLPEKRCGLIDCLDRLVLKLHLSRD